MKGAKAFAALGCANGDTQTASVVWRPGNNRAIDREHPLQCPRGKLGNSRKEPDC